MLEKNTHIEKLEKEIRFLSTLLSYWKPVDEVGERGKNQKQSDSRSEQSEGMDRSG